MKIKIGVGKFSKKLGLRNLDKYLGTCICQSISIALLESAEGENERRFESMIKVMWPCWD